MSCVVCYLAGSTKLLVGWHLGEVVHSTKSVVKKTIVFGHMAFSNCEVPRVREKP